MTSQRAKIITLCAMATKLQGDIIFLGEKRVLTINHIISYNHVELYI